MRGKAAKLGEGCQKVRLGQDSLPNIAISAAETSGKWGCCFTRTRFSVAPSIIIESLLFHYKDRKNGDAKILP